MNLDFTDLYIPDGRLDEALVFPGPTPLPQDMRDFCQHLMEKAKTRSSVDFTVTYNGITLRGHKMPTMNGDFYIFRKMPEKVWTLKDCKIGGRIKNAILSPRLNHGGLVVVSGMPGNGKSTTCAAVIVDRLTAFGGLCITVEDPVEMPLQGLHGKGVCLQRNLNNQEEFHAAVRDAMRAYPAQTSSMMLVGEVRDPETAALSLRSAVDGRLVLLTMHAGDAIQALHRLLSLAARSMGSDEARALCASGMRMIIHQKLVEIPGGGSALRLQTLLDTDAAAGVIRKKGVPLESLKNEINLQRNQLKMGLDIKLRRLS